MASASKDERSRRSSGRRAQKLTRAIAMRGKASLARLRSNSRRARVSIIDDGHLEKSDLARTGSHPPVGVSRMGLGGSVTDAGALRLTDRSKTANRSVHELMSRNRDYKSMRGMQGTYLV